MKILLTGFEPFGKIKKNPSEAIVRQIAPRTADRGYDLIAEVLPTEFRTADRKLRKLIRSNKPASAWRRRGT
jgi:pyrrolidone-carboxylate peptidase